MILRRVVYLFILLSLITITACSAIERKHNKQEKAEKIPPKYHQFHDILVPGELKEDKRNSSVIGTGNNATGFLCLDGTVDLSSVVHFFKIKVQEDGWKLISVLKSPFSTNMIFHKQNRWCLITLEEKGFTTQVGIGVSRER